MDLLSQSTSTLQRQKSSRGKTMRRLTASFLIFLVFASITTGLYATTNFEGENNGSGYSPSTATTGTPVQAFPSNFDRLYTNTPYNITTTVPPSALYESASCVQTYNGVQYANTSISIGVFNATYSFTNIAHGAKDPEFTDGTGKYDVQDYTGHNNTFRALMDTTGGNYEIVSQTMADQMTTMNFSFWFLTSAISGGAGIAEYFNLLDAGGASLIHIERYDNHFDLSCNGVGLTRLYTGVSAGTWYYLSIGIDFATKAVVVDINLARVGTFTASAALTKINKFSLSAYYNYVYKFYLDAIDYSFDPQFSYLRNYNQLLNFTSTFLAAGTYTYQFLAWLSGTRYDYPQTFMVVSDSPPANTAYDLDVLAAEYDLTVKNYLAITYTFHMRLLTTDSETYRVHFRSLSDFGDGINRYTIEKGDGSAALYWDEAPNGDYVQDPLLQADDALATSNVTFPFVIHSQYPIENGKLNWEVWLGSNMVPFSFQWPYNGKTDSSGAGIIRETRELIYDDPIDGLYYVQGVSATTYAMAPVDSYITNNYGIASMNFYPVAMGFTILGNTIIDDPVAARYGNYFSIEYYSTSYWNRVVSSGVVNREFNVILNASNQLVNALVSGITIGVCLWNNWQHTYLNYTQNIFSIPIGSRVTKIDYFAWNSTGDLIGTTTDVDPSITSVQLAIPSSYAHRVVYFAAFSNDGLGIPAETVRLYINGTRREWGPVDLSGSWFNVTVLDYINDSQYSDVLDLSHTSEINVFIQISEMGIINLERNESITVEISKGGILLQNQTIPALSFLSFRFTDGNYSVNCTFANGTVETRLVDVLASGTDLTTYKLNFGLFEEAMPPDLSDVKPGWIELGITLIVMVGIAVLIIALVVVAWRSSDRKYKRLVRQREETKLQSTYGIHSGVDRKQRYSGT